MEKVLNRWCVTQIMHLEEKHIIKSKNKIAKFIVGELVLAHFVNGKRARLSRIGVCLKGP